jgi:predicted component of type VI protein secretion system
MKKVFVFIVMISLLSACNSKKNLADESKDEPAAPTIPKEYYLVYAQKKHNPEFPYREVSSPLTICVILENDTIASYSLRYENEVSSAGVGSTNRLINSASVEIAPQGFEDFRNALEKALEWDRTARENNVGPFYFREIQSSIPFRNIEWYTMFDGLCKAPYDESFEFTFNWDPNNADFSKSILRLSSSVAYCFSSVSGKEISSSFCFNTEMSMAAVQDFLENTTDEKIKGSIIPERKFIDKATREAEEKKKIETLFN